MASGIEQLVMASQQQHQRYLDLFATSPINGDSLRELSNHLRTVSQSAKDTRSEVIGLDFSTAVTAPYAAATDPDHVPLDKMADTLDVAAQVADTSTQINLDGARSIEAIAKSEADQVSAIADPDSPAGVASILGIIERHQAESMTTVQNSTLSEQMAGQRALIAGTSDGAIQPAGVITNPNPVLQADLPGAGSDSTGPRIPPSVIRPTGIITNPDPVLEADLPGASGGSGPRIPPEVLNPNRSL